MDCRLQELSVPRYRWSEPRGCASSDGGARTAPKARRKLRKLAERKLCQKRSDQGEKCVRQTVVDFIRGNKRPEIFKHVFDGIGSQKQENFREVTVTRSAK